MTNGRYAPQIQTLGRGATDPETCRGRDLAATTIAAEPSKAVAMITPIPKKPLAVTAPSTAMALPIRKDICASLLGGVRISCGMGTL